MRTVAATLLLVPALLLSAAGGRGAAAGPAEGANGANGFDRCLAELAETDLLFDPEPEPPTGDACDLTDAVQVIEAGSAELSRPFLSTCPLAAAFDRFEREVLQPAAERHLGRRVARLEHSGTYRCSHVAGGAGRLSQHATANAIDVHAFVLEDGESVSVLAHWEDPGPAG
ncbi:MAG TPA: extensin family protein, partial [Geminicoccaceae bacterium]|nr:extensin family protein [Geminicoccaceae bacterium]